MQSMENEKNKNEAELTDQALEKVGGGIRIVGIESESQGIEIKPTDEQTLEYERRMMTF